VLLTSFQLGLMCQSSQKMALVLIGPCKPMYLRITRIAASARAQSRPAHHPQAPARASTKSLCSYPLAERDSLLRRDRNAVARLLAPALAFNTARLV
jgi:hypothetical protein